MALFSLTAPDFGHTNMASTRHHFFKMLEFIMQLTILPYYLLIFIYMIIYSSRPRPHEEVSAAVMKILPIWYLVLYVYKRNKDHQRPLATGLTNEVSVQVKPQNAANITDNNDYTRSTLTEVTRRPYPGPCVLCLIVSSVGDSCLVYKDLFLFGIFFFSIVHLLHLLILKKMYKSSSIAWLAVPLCCILYAVVWSAISDLFFKVVVLIYAILIHSMLFFAIASYESVPSFSTLSYMLGAILFVLSDFLIACNIWLLNSPPSEVAILLTYYMAQLLLTLGSS